MPSESGQRSLERKAVHREVDHRAGKGSDQAIPVIDRNDREVPAPTVAHRGDTTRELVVARMEVHAASTERSGREGDVSGEARVATGSMTDPKDRDLGKRSTYRAAPRRISRSGGHGTPAFRSA